VRLWDVESGKPGKVLEGHEDGVFAVSFARDGKRLASAGEDAGIILWDIESGKEIATLEGHSETINDLAFSPDGKFIASASDDRTARIWPLPE
jgi:WD40 repeat protein